MIDYYKMFGLDTNCSIEELEKSYKEKMLGLTSDDIIEYTFKVKYYREGYEVLKDKEVRRKYNSLLNHHKLSIYSNEVINNAFSDDEKENNKIRKEVEASMIETVISNPGLSFNDTCRKYIRLYEQKYYGKICTKLNTIFDVSVETLVSMFENNYNFIRNELRVPRQKIMTTK